MIRLDAEKFGSLVLVAANPKWVQTIFELAFQLFAVKSRLRKISTCKFTYKRLFLAFQFFDLVHKSFFNQIWFDLRKGNGVSWIEICMYILQRMYYKKYSPSVQILFVTGLHCTADLGLHVILWVVIGFKIVLQLLQ